MCSEDMVGADVGAAVSALSTEFVVMGLDNGVGDWNVAILAEDVVEDCMEDVVGYEMASVIVECEDDGMDCCEEVTDEILEDIVATVAAVVEDGEVTWAANKPDRAPLLLASTSKGEGSFGNGRSLGSGRSPKNGSGWAIADTRSAKTSGHILQADLIFFISPSVTPARQETQEEVDRSSTHSYRSSDGSPPPNGQRESLK